LDYRDHLGRRQRKVLSSDRRAAEQMRIELIRQRDLDRAGIATVDSQDFPLAELITLYLADLEGRCTPAHLRHTRRRLTLMLEAVGVSRAQDLKPIAVLQRRAALVRDGSSHRTANFEVSTFSTLLTWGVRAGLIGRNPLLGLKRLPETQAHQRCVRRAMTDDEIARFLAAAEEDDRRRAEHPLPRRAMVRGVRGRLYSLVNHGVRVPQAPLFQAYLETGARYFELVSITWEDLDWSGPTIALRAGYTKSRKARRIPIRAELAERLASLRAVHERILGRPPQASEHVFLSPEGQVWRRKSNVLPAIFYRVLQAAGIPRETGEGKLDIHALRHTAASRWARLRVPLVHAQMLLGHSTPALTAKAYTHLETEDLRAAVEAIAPATRSTGAIDPNLRTGLRA